MTKEELISKIATIKNATQKGENTAMRVGGAMEDMVNFGYEQIEQLKADADNGDVLKIYIDLSWVVEGVYNDTFPNPTEDDPYVLSASEIEQTFGMSKEVLINKILNAKHNIAFVSGTYELSEGGNSMTYKLNTISAFKGMVANGGAMAQLACPITIDMLEGLRGVIRIQSTSPNTMEVVFVLTPPDEPVTYEEISWDGSGTASIEIERGSIVHINRTNPNNVFDFRCIGYRLTAMIFAKFSIDPMTFTSVTFYTDKGETTISDLEPGDYQISCIFGNVSIQKIY